MTSLGIGVYRRAVWQSASSAMTPNGCGGRAVSCVIWLLLFGIGAGVGVGASCAGFHAWFWAGRSGLPCNAKTRLSEPSGDIVNSAPSTPLSLYTAILEPSGDQDALGIFRMVLVVGSFGVLALA